MFHDSVTGIPITDTHFVMGVDGRRIEPDFYDGDKAFVKKCVCLNIDDIEIFLKGSDYHIKDTTTDSETRMVVEVKDGYIINMLL